MSAFGRKQTLVGSLDKRPGEQGYSDREKRMIERGFSAKRKKAQPNGQALLHKLWN